MILNFKMYHNNKLLINGYVVRISYSGKALYVTISAHLMTATKQKILRFQLTVKNLLKLYRS